MQVDAKESPSAPTVHQEGEVVAEEQEADGARDEREGRREERREREDDPVGGERLRHPISEEGSLRRQSGAEGCCGGGGGGPEGPRACRGA